MSESIDTSILSEMQIKQTAQRVENISGTDYAVLSLEEDVFYLWIDLVGIRKVKESFLVLNRIKDCVNACAGMEDPEKEIQQLRERVAQLEAELEACNALDEVHHAEMSRLLSEKIKSFPEEFFVPCTEQEAQEVYELLESGGYKPIDKYSKRWTDEVDTGVKVYNDGDFQSFYNDENIAEITLDQLRKILTQQP